MTKNKNLNIKLNDEDWEVIGTLREVYKLDQTNLVRSALRHVLQTLPVFETRPAVGKLAAPVAEAASLAIMN